MLLRLGSVEHDLTTRTLVMGVVASGSQGSVIDQAARAVGAGADLLAVDAVPSVILALRARFALPLAVETAGAQVLGACAEAGAVLAHDPTGFVDPDYLATAARHGVTVVVVHARPLAATSVGAVATMTDVVREVRAFLAARVEWARAAGLGDAQILVDPGLDLGKSAGQSLALVRASASLADLGPALLLGGSERRYLGVLLGLETDERRMASHAATALGIARGARVVRTHDVDGTKRVATILQAVLDARLAQVEREG